MCVQHYLLMAVFLLEAFPCSQAEVCCCLHCPFSGNYKWTGNDILRDQDQCHGKDFMKGALSGGEYILYFKYILYNVKLCDYPCMHSIHCLPCAKIGTIKNILFFTVVKVTDIKHTILTIFNCVVQWHKYIHIVVKLSPSSISRIFHLPKLKFYPH